MEEKKNKNKKVTNKEKETKKITVKKEKQPSFIQIVNLFTTRIYIVFSSSYNKIINQATNSTK